MQNPQCGNSVRKHDKDDREGRGRRVVERGKHIDLIVRLSAFAFGDGKEAAGLESS